MRRLLLPGVLALALAIGLVLVLAGGEEDVAVDDDTAAETAPAATDRRPARPEPKGRTAVDVKGIEQAVTLYIEAAERGTAPAEGLPTTDELSIDRVVTLLGSDGATAYLVGGARVDLVKRAGRWRVERVRPGRTPPPTPPSNG
jgi:hypothetical protein